MSHRLLAAARAADEGSAARILELVGPKLEATEEIFRTRLASDVPFIARSGEYIFRGGGKRMRPALLLLSARMLGRDSDEEVTYAAVVEMMGRPSSRVNASATSLFGIRTPTVLRLVWTIFGTSRVASRIKQ